MCFVLIGWECVGLRLTSYGKAITAEAVMSNIIGYLKQKQGDCRKQCYSAALIENRTFYSS